MRHLVDPSRLERTLRALGREARSGGSVYLVGGASALLVGWRQSTVDIDIWMDPEPAGIFEAIRAIKEREQVNVELASPPDFIPEVPGWRERSVWIVRHAAVDFFHYDFVSQALAKLERGHQRDLLDVKEMRARSLVRNEQLVWAFDQIRPRLIRYPAISEAVFASRVEAFVAAEGET